jgi:hypothetical protein
VPHDNNSTNKKIGINKLGTLLSSQTTGANEYFLKLEFYEFFYCFAFLRCDVYNLFHSISLVKSAFSAIFHSIKNVPATIFSVSGFRTAVHAELLSIYLGILSSCSLCLFQLSGGDSENNTQGSGLLQIRLNLPQIQGGPVSVPAA